MSDAQLAHRRITDIVQGAAQFGNWALFRHADGLLRCPFTGANRKWPAKGKIDACPNSDIGQLLRVSASEDTGASLKVTAAFKLIKINSAVSSPHRFELGPDPKRALTCTSAERVCPNVYLPRSASLRPAKGIDGTHQQKRI